MLVRPLQPLSPAADGGHPFRQGKTLYTGTIRKPLFLITVVPRRSTLWPLSGHAIRTVLSLSKAARQNRNILNCRLLPQFSPGLYSLEKASRSNARYPSGMATSAALQLESPSPILPIFRDGNTLPVQFSKAIFRWSLHPAA